MWRRILLLLLLAVVLAGLVFAVFRTVYRDYLLVRRYHEGLEEGALQPEDIDADRLNEMYSTVLKEVSPTKAFNVKQAVMLHEVLWGTDQKEMALKLAKQLRDARGGNIGLRVMYADRLSEMGETELAEAEYRIILTLMQRESEP